MAKMLGYGADEMTGKHLFSFMDERGVEISTRNVERRKQGIAEQHDFEFLRKDGKCITVTMVTAPIIDQDGNYAGAIAGVIDITERKKAEETLTQSEKNYRDLFNNATDAIYIQDRECRFLDVNQGAVEMYGYPKEFFIGKTPEFLSAPGKNDLKKIAGFVKDAFNGKPRQYDFWGIRKNGEIFPKIVRSQKGIYMGKEVVVTFALDITERQQAQEELRKHREHLEELIAERTAELRESEEKSRAQYKGIPVPTYTWQRVGEDLAPSGDFMLVDYNDAALEVTQGGVANFVGTKATEMYRDRLEIRDEIERCFAAKTVIEREMVYHYTTTGESKHLAVKYAFVPPDLVLVHTEDITPRVWAQEEIEKRTAELRKVVNAMAGREVRMAELKDVIRKLRAQLEEAGLTPVADDPLLAGLTGET